MGDELYGLGKKIQSGAKVWLILCVIAFVVKAIVHFIMAAKINEISDYLFDKASGTVLIFLGIADLLLGFTAAFVFYFAVSGIGVLVKSAAHPGKIFEQNSNNELALEKNVRACPSCGHDIPSYSKFCPKCGLEIVSRLCPNCGSEMKDNSRFCHKCGYKNEGRFENELSEM